MATRNRVTVRLSWGSVLYFCRQTPSLTLLISSIQYWRPRSLPVSFTTCRRVPCSSHLLCARVCPTEISRRPCIAIMSFRVDTSESSHSFLDSPPPLQDDHRRAHAGLILEERPDETPLRSRLSLLDFLWPGPTGRAATIGVSALNVDSSIDSEQHTELLYCRSRSPASCACWASTSASHITSVSLSK